MSNPTPILNNINAFDATKGTTISFNIIGGTDIVRSNIVYIYDLSTNDLICTHLYISTESIHELPPNTDSSIVYASGKSSADFVNNKNYYLQIQTFTNTAGTAGGSGMSVAKTFWCLFDPALSVNAIPAAISTTSYNVGATYTTNITDVTIPVTNIIQQYKFDLYTATGTLVQTSGNIIGSGEQEGTSTTYNITYNFSGLVVNNSYYVVVTTTSTEGMTVSAQSNTFAVSIETPTVGGAIVNNNTCDGYISVVSNLSSEYGGNVSGEMASFETDSVNNVSSLKVNMEPIQDLHGYDKPWVGGAGKNLFDPSKGTPEPSNMTYGLTVTYSNDTVRIQGTPTTQSVSLGFNFIEYADDSLSGKGYVVQAFNVTGTPIKSLYGFRTATEPRCAIVFDSVANPTIDCSFKLSVASTSQTSWTPYSNICPISGHDEVEVGVVGKNLLDSSSFVQGSIYSDTGIEYDVTTRVRSPYIRLLAGQYTISSTNGFDSIVYVFDENKQLIQSESFMSWQSSPHTYSISGTRYIRVIFRKTDNSVITPSELTGEQLELGTTATTYEPYTAETIHQDIEVTYTPTVQDNEPYLFKQTGDVGGDRESIELVGGTVAWNQLVLNGDFSNGSTRWSAAQGSFSVSNGEATIVTTGTYGQISHANISYVSGHKYLMTAYAKSADSLNISVGSAAMSTNHIYTLVSSSYTLVGSVYNCTNTRYTIVTVTTKNGGDNKTYTVKNVMCIDLTQMFGSTIADYIYSLEQATAGAGVAWFKKLFPKPYYEYNAGTLRSVEGVSAHETVGFNQWDEEWENGWIDANGNNRSSNSEIRSKNYIPVIPNTAYYFNVPKTVDIHYYDADKQSLGVLDKNGQGDITSTNPNKIRVTHDNCHYIRFWVYDTTTYNNDICINLSSPSRNGEYEPYTKHTYPLDSSLTLRGIPKLVDGKLAFDGDVYPPSGEVQRRYGVVDLGTLNWSGDNNNIFRAAITGMKPQSDSEGYETRKQGAICAKYSADSQVAIGSKMSDKTWLRSANYIVIRDTSYTDAASFKAAMSGVMLVYEKATPTTETAEPFTNPQVVDNRGTEAYITTGIVPVGHDTTYLTRDIFGGTLDMVTGVLTVDRKMVDLGTLNWSKRVSGVFYTWSLRNLVKAVSSTLQIANAKCSALKLGSYNDVYNNATLDYAISVGADSQLGAHCSAYAKDADFKSAMSGVMLCYELATPQTYQLTPHQIQTLVGQNNVWSDAGDVEVTFNLPISNLLVKRQDASDVSGDWLTLYSQPITQASDMDFTFIDFLNQHGKTYRYALVPLLTQQQGDIDVEIEGGYTVSDNVLSVFDGVFVANNNGSQKLKAATEYGDLETNQDVGVLTTIGNKYPFVVSNSNLNYHSGSISALIVPSDFYTNGDLDRLDIVERREAIEKFLTDKTAKVLKDWNGNIWLITFVENVEVSFVDDYGMGLGTLSAKWVEIGDVNDQTDLKQTGLI